MTDPAQPSPIRRAMVLAAGLGLRMRPITKTTPKPLVVVRGRTLLDRAIDRLVEAGVDTVVVNMHHLAEKVEKHLAGRETPRIILSQEPTRLETGGGVAHALKYFDHEPFFVVNGDALILNGPRASLADLAARWDDACMDGLLLVHPTVEAFGYEGAGDFRLDPVGRITRRPERQLAPYIFTGVQILHPRLFKEVPEAPFSLNVLYDRAIEGERLYGVLHDGKYFHVGTPAHLELAEAYLARMHSGVRRT